jgi:hypothetical protein
MWELLAVNRVNTIMRALQDVRELPQQLLFLNRTPIVEATDEEIVARFTGNVVIADVVADDQEALVRSNGSITLDTTKIPNIKHGTPITQSMINLIERIEAGGGIRDDVGIVDNWLNRSLDNLLIGVRQRMEYFLIGAALDSVTYNRLGVNFTATFGTPSDLKVTVSHLWSSPSTGTPVSDLQTQQALGREKYGKNYNRFTMTSVVFRDMIATTEFRDKSALYNQLVGITSATFPIADIPAMTQMAGRILSAQIELYDAKYQQENSASTLTVTGFFPDDKVLLSDTSDDNSGMAMDFANGIVTESVVAELTGLTVIGGGENGGFGGPVSGPVSYATAASPDLNPPGMNLWAVARGFPRKHDLAMTSVLTVA